MLGYLTLGMNTLGTISVLGNNSMHAAYAEAQAGIMQRHNNSAQTTQRKHKMRKHTNTNSKKSDIMLMENQTSKVNNHGR